MSEATAPRVDVHVGEVTGSQLVIGDHTTVQTAKGTKVTILQVGERPVPHLRRMPLAHRPPLRADVYGRDAELAAANLASPQAPVEIYGPEGIGKTVLLKRLAQGPGLREGMVFESTRRRTLDEILSSLYSACWECEIPYLPAAAEVQSFLVDREALVVLDDCGLDREDLETLLDTAPRCAFVIGAEERTLWSQGSAERLQGLDPDAALQLLEHELRGLEAADRAAAETLVERLEGHPQRIIEAAALISSGTVSLGELSDGAADVSSRLSAQPLTEGERRIIALLGLLDGAALGTTHISAVTGLRGASEQLVGLERRGWVKSSSPRYRLVRSPPQQEGEPVQKRLVSDLLAHLIGFAREDRTPASVAEEAEAIDAALAFAAQAGRWPDVLALARESEVKLAPSGAWGSWRSVLLRGLQAARALADDAAEAHMRHQLGSLALCLGEREEAASQLAQALHVRERIGDRPGAELTRHNLRQLETGPPSGGNGKRPTGPRWPPRPMTLGILATAVAALIAVGVVLALSSGASRTVPATKTSTAARSLTAPASKPATTPPSQPSTSDTTRPTIIISSPTHTTYRPKQRVIAQFECSDTGGSGLSSCMGSVENGSLLDTSPGVHSFSVTAKDQAGNSAERTVTYSVEQLSETSTQPTPTTSTSPPGLLLSPQKALATPPPSAQPPPPPPK